jgi:hemolysin activation/secretion protein
MSQGQFRLSRGAAILAMVVAVASAADGAFAQVPRQQIQIQLPPSVDPGRLQDLTPGRRIESETPDRPPAVPAPDAPTQTPVPNAERIRFTLRSVVIEGATVYPASQFAPLYQASIGQQITLAQLFQIANQITLRYRQDGYILSRAVVPAQQIGADGVARIRVVEGYIANVSVEGEGARNLRVQQVVSRLTQFRPLRADQLERFLLLANDLPGIRARGVLTPSRTVDGASDLTVVAEDRRVDGYVGIDNRGTRFVGPEQLFSAIGFNNLLDFGERTVFRVTVTPWDIKELRSFEAAQTWFVGGEGTQLIFSVSHLRSRPGLTLRPLRVLNTGTTGQVQVRHPWIRSRSENLYTYGTFAVRDLRTSFLDDASTPPSTLDRLRVLRAGVAYDFVDNWQGVNTFAIEFSQGLQFLNATRNDNPLRSRTDARTDFRKLLFEAARLQSLSFITPGLQLQVSASAQFHLGTGLPASEQYGLGGLPFGRSYNPSEITGDSGFGGSIELQYGRAVGVDWLRRYLREYQAYVYYDGGIVWDNTSTGTRLPNLQSVGVGLRLNAASGLTANLEVNKALSRGVAVPHTPVAEANSRPVRFFFSVVGRY